MPYTEQPSRVSVCKQGKEQTEFDSLCRELEALFPAVLSGFCRQTESTTLEWTYTLLYLGFRLKHVMEMMQDIMQRRSRMLCHEHTEAFQNVICTVDKHMADIMSFAEEADYQMQYAADDPCVPHRDVSRLFRHLKKLEPWIQSLLADEELMEAAANKYEELHLQHDVVVYPDMPQKLRCWTGIMLCVMTMLSTPQHIKASREKMAQLLEDSFRQFCQDEEQQKCMEDFGRRIREIISSSTQADALQKLREQEEKTKHHINNMLKHLGIWYKEPDSADDKAYMGRELYDALNGQKDMKMSNDDLMHYFAEEQRLQLLRLHIKPLKQALQRKCVRAEQNESMSKQLFRTGIRPEVKAEELKRVFRYYFGEDRMGELKGKYAHEVDLAAILYILLRKKGLLLSHTVNGKEKDIAPYYQFITENVWQLRPTYRTLYNRLTQPNAYADIMKKYCSPKFDSHHLPTGDEWENLFSVASRMK